MHFLKNFFHNMLYIVKKCKKTKTAYEKDIL